MIKMTDSEKLKKLNDDVTEVIVISRLIDDLRHCLNNSMWLFKNCKKKVQNQRFLKSLKRIIQFIN